eukprot:6587725-Karenia_brevis.AAC.1
MHHSNTKRACQHQQRASERSSVMVQRLEFSECPGSSYLAIVCLSPRHLLSADTSSHMIVPQSTFAPCFRGCLSVLSLT